MTQIDKLTNKNGFFITNPSEIIICQHTGQPERNGKIPKHLHTTKTQAGRNRKFEQTHN